MKVCYFDRGYRDTAAREVDVTWDALVAELSTHLELPNAEAKLNARMIGPFELRPGGTTRQNHHVGGVTVAMFDVDQGDAAAVERSRQLIEAAGYAQHWYTTASYVPGAAKESWRLMIPLGHQVNERWWRTLRPGLIKRFALAVEETKCSGVSHAYFVPCAIAGQPRATFTRPGKPYFLIPEGGPIHSMSNREPVVEVTASEYYPEGEGAPLSKLRGRLRQAAARREQNGDEHRGALLRRVADGVSLVGGIIESKSGDPPLASVVMLVVNLLHPQPRETYVELFEPTLEAMGFNRRKFARMLDSAAQKYAIKEAEDREFKERMARVAQSVRESWGISKGTK